MAGFPERDHKTSSWQNRCQCPKTDCFLTRKVSVIFYAKGRGRENIADEKTNLNPEMPEKASGEAASCREAQKEEEKAVQKVGRMAKLLSSRNSLRRRRE